ncbi:MAG: hypothetical protein J6M39_03710 [Lachnospiraceae bacterium]|nr:hypothetical protein [Lachnospiraceae bacterium]
MITIKFKKCSHEEGVVKRADNNLRANYYSLQTIIYKINESKYEIQLVNMLDFFDVIKNEFDKAIKPFYMNIALVKEMPKEFTKVVNEIDVTNDTIEGIYLNREDMIDLLESKFPIKIIKSNITYSEEETVLHLEIYIFNNNIGISDIKDFVLRLGVGFKDVEIQIVTYSNVKTKKSEFTSFDNDYWFENSKKIFSNEIELFDTKYYIKDKSKCYIDYTIYKYSYLDIRNLILIYDIVYLSLPSNDHMDRFYQEQEITKNDLIELVERGRVIIVLTARDDFYDQELLNELYKKNKNIISLRGLNNITALFFCNMYKKWRVKWNFKESELIELQKKVLKNDDFALNQFYKYIMWPYYQYYYIQNLINLARPQNIMWLGINNVIETDKISDIVFYSSSIHIAAMLEASYFPSVINSKNITDAELASLLYSLLNVHMYPFEYERADINNFTYFCDKNNNALKLLSCDKGISIHNYIDYSEKYGTTNKLLNIVKFISDKKNSMANKLIDEINNDIATFRIKKSNVFDLLLSGAGVANDVGLFPNIVSFILKLPLIANVYDELSINHRLQNNVIDVKDIVSYMAKLQGVVSLRRV